jgi:hypothetical protein
MNSGYEDYNVENTALDGKYHDCEITGAITSKLKTERGRGRDRDGDERTQREID